MRPPLWERLAPPNHIRYRQDAYDRSYTVHRMRSAGYTLTQIGRHLGISASRARQLEQKFRRYHRSPIEEWLTSLPSPGGEIVEWERLNLSKARAKSMTVNEAYTIVGGLSIRQRIAMMIVLDDLKERQLDE